MIKIDYTSNINKQAKTSVTLVPMAADDPRRRFYEIGYGLNIKGSCKNSSCISASYQMQDHIFVKKGYGIFDMGLIKYKNVCPVCQTPMAPDSFKNIGYCHARVTIQGNKLTTLGGYFVKTTEEDFTGNLIMLGSKQASSSEFSEWHSVYFTVKKGNDSKNS